MKGSNDMGVAAHLWGEVQDWSRETFGPAELRGPIGPLKHLAKEAKEAQESPDDIREYADCLILIIDAASRAGFSLRDLLKASLEKMEENRARSWPKLDAENPNEPVEHLK